MSRLHASTVRLAFCAAAIIATMSLIGCATTTQRLDLPSLETVEEVDLDRYVGTWYEIANYPLLFQRRCTGTTATYALRDDGLITVENRCFRDSLDGREISATGRARVPDASDSGKLEVSFFGPFWGDYWVIDLGEEYDYAVVSSPSRDSLWILSRTPTMEPSLYDSIIGRLRADGFTLEDLQETVQG